MNSSAIEGSPGAAQLATLSSSSRPSFAGHSSQIRKKSTKKLTKSAKTFDETQKVVGSAESVHALPPDSQSSPFQATARRSVVVRAIYSQVRSRGFEQSSAEPIREGSNENLQERRNSGKFFKVAGAVRQAAKKVLVERNMVNCIAALTQDHRAKRALDAELASLAAELEDFQNDSKNQDGTKKAISFFNSLMNEIASDPNLQQHLDIREICAKIHDATKKVCSLRRASGSGDGKEKEIQAEIDRITEHAQAQLATCLQSCQEVNSQQLHGSRPGGLPPLDSRSDEHKMAPDGARHEAHPHAQPELWRKAAIVISLGNFLNKQRSHQPADSGNSQAHIPFFSTSEPISAPAQVAPELLMTEDDEVVECYRGRIPSSRMLIEEDVDDLDCPWRPPRWVADLKNFHFPPLPVHRRPSSRGSDASSHATDEEFLPDVATPRGSELLVTFPHPGCILSRRQQMMRTGCRARPKITVENVVQHRENRGTKYAARWLGVKYEDRNSRPISNRSARV